MSEVLEVREPRARYLSAEEPALVRHFETASRAPAGTSRLRELILDLAIRGKLVRQDLDDPPAPALLREIETTDSRQRRSRSADEVAEPISGEAPFEIPGSWMWVRLGQVVDIVRGITFPASEKTREAAPGRIACLRTANIQHAIEWGDLLFVDRSFVGRDDQLLRHHDIVMSMANSRELVGKVALVDYILHDESTFGGFLGVLRPWKVEPGYVMALLRSPYARGALIDSASQTTNIANISLGKLRPLPVPLPPLAEQARIVARVDELMRLCDALEEKGRLEAEQHARLLSTLLGTLTDSATPEELAANWQRVAEHFDLLLDRPEAVDELESNVLALAAQGRLTVRSSSDESASALLERVNAEKQRLSAASRLRLDKPSTPVSDAEQRFQLPEGWKWTRLQDLAVAIVDCPHSTPKFVPSGVLCLDTNSFKKGQLLNHKLRFVDEATYAERIERLEPRPGDLVFAREGSVGESLIIPAGTRACLGQRVMLFRFSSLISVEYVRLAISSPSFLGALLELHKGIGAKHVNVGDMRQAVVPLPPLAEQRRIVERVGVLLRLCATLRARLQAQQATQSRLAEALVEQALA